MTSFEEELTDLLDARAERVTVRRGDPGEDSIVLLETLNSDDVVVPISEGSAIRKPGRDRRQWLFGAAAAVVVVLGVFALTRGSGTPVTEIAGPSGDAASEDYVASVLGDELDFVVWMQPSATQDEIDAVMRMLDESPMVESLQYLGRGETYAEFQEFWADEPEILAAVEPNDLPTSFRVSMADALNPDIVTAFVQELQLLSGIREVQRSSQLISDEAEEAARVSVPTAPLFLLPSVDYLSSAMDGQTSNDEFPAIETMVVGLRTDTGFTDMVIIERSAERGFLATSPIETGGRTVEPFIDQDGLVAEQLDDGTWLRYTSWRNPDFLDVVVPATTVTDGRIVFEASVTGFEVLMSSMPGPNAGTVTSVFGDEGPQMIISTSVLGGDDAELFAVAANDGDAERFSNAEIDGYFLRSSSSTSLGGLNGFSWRITADHTATLLLPGSDDEVLAAVAGVRAVDEATWQAALDGELATAEALFLLPSDEALLEGLQGFISGLEDWSMVQESSAIAVGRPTETGFDQLMAVAILDEREFSDSESRVIDERQIFVDRDEAMMAAELLEDGRWLHFYFNAIDNELSVLVEATSVVDGEISFEPYDEIVELSRASGLSPTGPTTSASPGSDGEGAISISTVPRSEDLVLVAFAVSFEAVTTVEVRGQSGFQVLSDDPVNPGDAVGWFEPSGHMVVVTIAAPRSAIDVAESLIVVDEATWRAAIPLFELD